MDISIVALVVAGVTLVWQVGQFVASKTSTKVDDALFNSDEIRDAVLAIVKSILENRVKVTEVATAPTVIEVTTK